MTSRPTLRACAVLSAIVTLAVPAGGQQFALAKLRASTDSFEVAVNGTVRGFFRTTLARDGDNYRFVSDLSVPMAGAPEHKEVVFNATTGMPLSYVSRENAGGGTSVANIAIAGGRATGTLELFGKTTTVGFAIPDGTFEDTTFPALLSTLDLVDGLRTSFSSPAYRTGVVAKLDVTVSGRDSVTVLAGRFDAFRVQLKAPSEALTLYITTSAPRRMVLLVADGGVVEMRLVTSTAGAK